VTIINYMDTEIYTLLLKECCNFSYIENGILQHVIESLSVCNHTFYRHVYIHFIYNGRN
jgi:hypothetical protein